MTPWPRIGGSSKPLLVALVALATIAAVAASRPVWYPNTAADGIGHLLHHVDHADSPAKQTFASDAERIQTYVVRDQARWSRLLRQPLGNATAAARFAAAAAAASNNFKQNAANTGTAQYYVNLPFGTPRQSKLLLFDTGSNLIWIQGLCKSCYRESRPHYNPAASSTYRPLLCSSALCHNVEPMRGVSAQVCPKTSRAQCPYTYLYGTGQSETRGVLATETVTLPRTRGGTAAIHNILFGVGQYNEGFPSAIDGLLGTGRSSVSLPSQLRPYYTNVFSTCFTPFTSGKASQVVYGQAAVPARGIAYTPLLTNPADPELTFYYVQVSKVTVAARNVGIPASAWALDRTYGGGGTLLDTGSNFAQLTGAAFGPIFNAVAARAAARGLTAYDAPADSGLYGPCFYVTPARLDALLPPITFFFSGKAYWTLLPRIYMIQYTRNVFCNSVLPSTEPGNVIGALLMTDSLLVFDAARNRMGFKTIDCITGRALKP